MKENGKHLRYSYWGRMLEMKIARHAQIIKLINQYDIETQEEAGKEAGGERLCRNAGDDFEGYPAAEAHKSTKRERREASYAVLQNAPSEVGSAMRAC